MSPLRRLHKLLERPPAPDHYVIRGAPLIFPAALALAALVTLELVNMREEVPSPADSAGARISGAFEVAAGSPVVVAIPVALGRAELLSSAFEAAPPEAKDPALRAALWAKGRGKLLARRVCGAKDWADVVTFCEAARAGFSAKSVQTVSLAGTPDERSSLQKAMGLLDGKWSGDGFVLDIDGVRAQAHVDPRRPYQWDRYALITVLDGALIFNVGPDVYRASIQEKSLVLSSTSFRGERRLDQQVLR